MSTEPVSPLPNRAPMGGALQQCRIMAVLETGTFPGGPGPDLTRVAAAADTLVANGVGAMMLTNAAPGTIQAGWQRVRPPLDWVVPFSAMPCSPAGTSVPWVFGPAWSAPQRRKRRCGHRAETAELSPRS